MILGDRFWSKVEKTESCWLWIAYRQRLGYGVFRIDGRSLLAHRLAYMDAYGPIPAGLDIDHICRTRNCVNPAHLQAVTRRQNMQNRDGAQANNKSSGVRGVWRYPNGWGVTVKIGNVRHWGGLFKDLDEATAAASALRRALMPNSLADQI